MTDTDIDKLRKDYRAIEAPPALATRVRAHTDERGIRRRRWVPGAIGASLAMAVVFLLLATLQQSDRSSPTLVADNNVPKPSMASLARVMKKRPSVSVPRLSQVRISTLPAPPPKPRPRTEKPSATKSYLDIQPSISKEKDHAHS